MAGNAKSARGKRLHRQYTPPQGDTRGAQSANAKPMSVLRGDDTKGTLKMKKATLRTYTPPIPGEAAAGAQGNRAFSKPDYGAKIGAKAGGKAMEKTSMNAPSLMDRLDRELGVRRKQTEMNAGGSSRRAYRRPE